MWFLFDTWSTCYLYLALPWVMIPLFKRKLFKFPSFARSSSFFFLACVLWLPSVNPEFPMHLDDHSSSWVTLRFSRLVAFSCILINAAKCPLNKQDLKALQNCRYRGEFESSDKGNCQRAACFDILCRFSWMSAVLR